VVAASVRRKFRRVNFLKGGGRRRFLFPLRRRAFFYSFELAALCRAAATNAKNKSAQPFGCAQMISLI
jgi:hypothetical protein